MNTIKIILRIVIALFFIITGVQHFLDPQWFFPLVPPFLPNPLLLIYISGFFEICGGGGY